MVSAIPTERRLIGDPVMTGTDRLDFFLIGEPPVHPKQPNPQAFHLFDERGYRSYGLTEQILQLRVPFGLRLGAILAGLWRFPHRCAPTASNKVSTLLHGGRPLLAILT
jgi:hypothetical protein